MENTISSKTPTDTHDPATYRVHRTALGVYAPDCYYDTQGYAPLPGARMDDHFVDLSEEPEPWWWPQICAANARAFELAEQALAAWRASAKAD